jgi:predicted  nucleic acid-binding Zn-ribbon protein
MDLDQLRSEMHHMSHDLVEQMRDSETNLLKAFYNYAETSNKRLTMVEMANAGVQDRLAGLENRILEVEKRLNMPPTS